MSRRGSPIGRLLDRLFNKLADTLIRRMGETALHPKTVLLKKAQEEAAIFAEENMPNALILNSQQDVLALCLRRAPETGLVLEFGVAGGESIRFLAQRTSRPIHGFDSFEGMPEDWGGRHEEKGHYSTGGRLPSVPASVTLHKGWFESTLPAFLDTNGGPVAFAHIDCDLYTSTKTVLDAIAPRLVAGSVLVFDEFFNIPNWRENEYRAFREFVKDHDVAVSYICWAYQQVAVRIDNIRNTPDRVTAYDLR